MTPKEKAKELKSKMWLKIPARYTSIQEMVNQKNEGTNDSDIAKKCALIAVEEIIAQIEPSLSMDVISARINYWQEVKQEIELL
jgi:hypothetical protein